MNPFTDLRSAMRQIAKQPALLSTVAIPLVLGIGTTVAAFSAMKTYLENSTERRVIHMPLELKFPRLDSRGALESRVAFTVWRDAAPDAQPTLVRFRQTWMERQRPFPLEQTQSLRERSRDLLDRIESVEGFDGLNMVLGPTLLGIVTALAASIPTPGTAKPARPSTSNPDASQTSRRR